MRKIEKRGSVMYTLLVTDKCPQKSYNNCVIATTKPNLFEKLTFQTDIEIESLESDEEQASDEVWGLLDRYSDVLKIIPEEYRWMYESDYAIEDQGLRQHISDLILTERIVKSIFSSYNIIKVNLFIEASNFIECLTIYEMAVNRGIPVKIHYESFRLFVKAMISPIAQKMFAVGAVFRANVKFCSLWLGCKESSHDYAEYDVGLLMFSDAIKHYNWQKDMMLSTKQNIRNYALVCLGCDGSYTKAKAEGIHALRVEEWMTRKSIMKVWKIYNKYAWKYKKLFAEFDYSLEGEIFEKNIKREIAIDFSWRSMWVLKMCSYIESFLKYNKFKFIKIFRGIDWQLNKAFYYYSRDYGTKLIESNYPTAYLVHRKRPNVNLLSIIYSDDSDIWTSVFKDYKGERILLNRSSFSKRIVEELPQSLDIDRKKIRILWAPTYIAKGSGKHSEWEKNNFDVIEGANKRENIELIVKYHLRQDEEDIKVCKQCYKDLKIVNKNQSIEDQIEKADIVISDTSTVLYEAVNMGKITISICNEHNSLYISDIIPYIKHFSSAKDLYAELDMYSKEDQDFKGWTKSILDQQNELLINWLRKKNEMYITDYIAQDLKTRLGGCEV